MQTDLLDLSYLYEIAENDTKYVYDVLEIFLSTIPIGLDKLQDLIHNSKNWDAIYRQAHFLKSSVSIVRVKGMFDELNQIEALANTKKGKKEIVVLFDSIMQNFNLALPLIETEKDKVVPAS